MPEQTVTIEPDGTRVTVEYRINDDGKRVKVTRRTRTKVVHIMANHAIAERKVKAP